MKKLILIIGMDNTGKTTLADKLSEKLNVKKTNLDYSKYKDFTSEEYLKEIDKVIENNEVSLFERFTPIEEQIYGKLLRGKSKFEFCDLRNFIEKYHPYIIYCRPPVEKIKSWGNREQMSGVVEKADELIKGFDDLVVNLHLIPNSASKFCFFKYDYSDPSNCDLLLEKIGLYMREEI